MVSTTSATVAKTHQTLLVFNQFNTKQVVRSIVQALLLFVASLAINYVAGVYASSHAGAAVQDIILDHLPTFDVDGIFVYGIAAFFVFVAALLFWAPRAAPFVIKSISLFIVIRAFFVCLTHIGPLSEAVAISANSIANLFTFTGDLFFSAHTGLPFLLALIFWKQKVLRIIFLSFSLVLGVVVLLGHLHYSIDVFSAFFITYGIYHIGQYIFKKDFQQLQHCVQ